MINSPFHNSPPFFSVYVNIKTVGHYETGGIFYTSPIHTLFLQYGIKKIKILKMQKNTNAVICKNRLETPGLAYSLQSSSTPGSQQQSSVQLQRKDV